MTLNRFNIVRTDINFVSYNFQEEIRYIKSNFDAKYIGDFVNKFISYVKSKNYNFSYICISYINLSLPECSSQIGTNCCYYYINKNLYVDKTLIPVNISMTFKPQYKMICFFYNLTDGKNYLSNFFCT